MLGPSVLLPVCLGPCVLTCNDFSPAFPFKIYFLIFSISYYCYITHYISFLKSLFDKMLHFSGRLIGQLIQYAGFRHPPWFKQEKDKETQFASFNIQYPAILLTGLFVSVFCLGLTNDLSPAPSLSISTGSTKLSKQTEKVYSNNVLWVKDNCTVQNEDTQWTVYNNTNFLKPVQISAWAAKYCT